MLVELEVGVNEALLLCGPSAKQYPVGAQTRRILLQVASLLGARQFGDGPVIGPDFVEQAVTEFDIGPVRILALIGPARTSAAVTTGNAMKSRSGISMYAR